MDNLNCSTEHRKGQHITREERNEIEVRLKDGWSAYKIAKHLGRPYNTISNEIKRGLTPLYNGKVHRYKAETAEKVYLEHRKNSRRTFKLLTASKFIQYVVDQFQKEEWSLDASFGHALRTGKFRRKEMVCTKTLYNYIDLSLIPLTNMDLPEKLKRKTKGSRVRENKRILGDSIDDRPKEIDTRMEFGHWEIDSVLGKKGKDEPVVVTIVERKLRKSLWMKAADHSAEAMQTAVKNAIDYFGDQYREVFKSITADNGSEFAMLSELKELGIPVYFTHPYASFEKGTNECHNRMLRRFIPKGRSINDYSADDILIFGDIINNLPRKILGYYTPDELFDAELDRIYTR